MANGHPKFTGTAGTLDIGQVGGTRQAAGSAYFTGVVLRPPDEAGTIERPIVQQNVVFADRLGYRGETVIWQGVLRCNSQATLNAIIGDLNEAMHGARRDASGNLTAADPTKVKTRQLTDYEETVLSNAAILRTWRITGRRRKTPEWAVLVEIAIEFRLLG